MRRSSFPYSWIGAISRMDSTRGAWSRGQCKLANNTYLVHMEGEGDARVLGVKFHRTVIVEFHPDGRVFLNQSGWSTSTTRERMCRAGVAIYASAGVQTVVHDGRSFAYSDGMCLHPNGEATTVSGAPAGDGVEAVREAKREKAREYRARRAANGGEPLTLRGRYTRRATLGDSATQALRDAGLPVAQAPWEQLADFSVLMLDSRATIGVLTQRGADALGDDDHKVEVGAVLRVTRETAERFLSTVASDARLSVDLEAA